MSPRVEPDHIDELLFEPRVVADLEGVDSPRLEVVIGPDLGHRVLPDPHPSGHRPRRPVRRAVSRSLIAGQPQDLFDRARWKGCLAATTLRDHPDPGRPLRGEPRTPPSHRVGVNLAPPGNLLVRDSIGRPQHRPGLHHDAVRSGRRTRHRHQLIAVSRCHPQRGGSWSRHTRSYHQTPCYFADTPLGALKAP